LLKEMASKIMLETVELREIGSCRKKKTSCLLDTGSDLPIVSPEWCEEMKVKIKPWEGPHLRMANATPADVIGIVEISVANERGRACGSALVIKLNGYELLMGNNFLRQFKSLSIRYHEKGHEIILGEELPVEAAVISADKCRVQMLRGKLIPKQSIVRVAVAAIGTDEKQEAASAWVLTPANHLLERKNLAAAHSILPGPFPTAVYVANLSNRDEWLPKRACIGYIESAQIQVEGEEKEEKVDTKQESEILLTRADLEKQLNPALDDVTKGKALDLLWQHIRVFAQHDLDLGLCTAEPMRIDTGDAKPICSKPFPVSWKALELQKTYTDNMVKQGIIEPSNSVWKSPVVLTRKPDNTYRFCIDFRLINRVTVRDTYPLPTVQETLLRLEGSIYFSSCDLQAGYYQWGLEEASRDKTSFVTMDGEWRFKVCPMGVSPSPGAFSRMMASILGNLRWTHAICFLDDIVTMGRTLDEHLSRLDDVLECIEKSGMKIKLRKCHFLEAELKVLGHIVSAKGVACDPAKVKAVSDFPEPPLNAPRAKQIKHLQAYLGLANFYRRMVPNFALIAMPLTQLLKKNAEFVWEKEQRDSFNAIKQALVNSAINAFPKYDLPMHLYTDACGYGIGGCLSKRQNGPEEPE